MRRLIAAFAVCVALAGCQTQPGTINDVHTGVSGKHSGMHSVYNGLFDSMWVATMMGTRGGETRYGVGTRYISTGIGWAFFREAWSYGRQLKFSATNERLLGCSGGCSMIEEGSIQLSKSEFEAASRTGFEFKLVGKNRQLVVKIPAKVFQEALNVK